MSAPAYPLPAASAPQESATDFGLDRLAPREGWSAFFLVAAMLVLVAWSLDVADYRGGSLGWLTWVMVLGAGWGLLSAKLRLPAWEAHALGALIGAGVVLTLVSDGVSSDPDLGARLSALGQAATQWYRDVSGPNRVSQLNIAWQVSCGVVAWATAHFSSYAVFGHRRPLPAIIVPGLFLVLNMLIAAAVDVLFLVLFSACALLLLVRLNLVDQREEWDRRRFGEATGVGSVATRSGTILVGGAVVLAFILATMGASAPLRGLWDTFQGKTQDTLLRLNDWFNLSPAVRFHGDAFAASEVITGEWDASDEPSAQVVFSDGQPHYLRAATYDTFVEGNRWLQNGVGSAPLAAGESLIGVLAGDGDLALALRSEVTTRVTTIREARAILSPAVPKSVSIPVRIERLGDPGPFAGLRPPGGPLQQGAAYEVVALVPNPGDAGFTRNLLRVAGRTYPPEILDRYTAIDARAFAAQPADHPSVAQLASDLVRERELRNPFDVADAVQRYLSDQRNFRYSSNVRGRCRPNEPAADCFLRIRAGYCEYYATTMILMLRSQGIPARLAVGYLPPGLDGLVRSSAAHAWVEVYFPGYGWVPFDPTGGNGAAPVEYVEGAPVTSGTPPPDSGSGLGEFRGRGETEGESIPEGAGPLTDLTGGSPLSLVFVAAAVLVALALYALVRLRRPRRAADPVAVYGGMSRIAALLGFPQRPWQTVFEYAGVLSEVVPEARPELRAVATAKVEATYRPGALERERLEAVAKAYRKLRLELGRLLFRRGRRQAVEAEQRRRARGTRLPGGSPWRS